MPQDHPKRLMKRAAVQEITAISRSTLYEMMRKGTFPRPVQIGERAVAWRESDIIDWIDQRPEAGEIEP